MPDRIGQVREDPKDKRTGVPRGWMKKRVIVCGYPKSGNTWLVRLAAELIGCPVIGYWCAPFNQDVAIEGLDRDSDFHCFKSHHSTEQLERTLEIYGNGSERIIYIYRDPRAVVASAFRFFTIRPRFRRIHSFLSAFPGGARLYSKLLHSDSYKWNVLANGLVAGTQEGAWLATPWKTHLQGYLERKDILCLNYESLQCDPFSQGREICRFLSIDRSDTEVRDAVRKQSFDYRRREFRERGEEAKADFLRRGLSEGWRGEVPTPQVQLIEAHIGDFLRQLGYSLSDAAARGKSDSSIGRCGF